VSAADFRKIKKIDHLRMFFLLQLIREFEDTLLELKDADLVHGPVHSSIGQEANAAAAAVVLKKSDLVGSTHRAHGHFLAKAVMYYAPEDFNPELNDFTADMQRAVNKTLAEIMGLKSGWCAGRGGSMHLSDPASGNIGSNGIVGGGIPLATGAAWAEKLSAGSRVVVSFFGDGAINQGCFHEVANMASLWDLPIVYFVENNLYAVATATCTSSSCINLGLRSLGYGIDSLIARQPLRLSLPNRGDPLAGQRSAAGLCRQAGREKDNLRRAAGRYAGQGQSRGERSCRFLHG
jgi:2-oxoisovalerate dehydrogenase E1 component